FDKPITLRQMMSHRSGLVRESPVGHYFDASRPSIADTVRSLNTTTLVYEPETHTKYSNAAITVVGYVLERTQDEPFASYVKRTVLDPIGLRRTGFEPSAEMTAGLAVGQMWTYDGRTFDAPTWPLGTAPAGNLYATVTDLARFLSVLFAEGRLPSRTGTLLKADTIRQMWTPQLVKPSDRKGPGFGLGFMLDELDGHRRVGHGGAVYGFATEVSALPDEKLGAVVITTRDCANAVTRRIADTALRGLLALNEGKPVPAVEPTEPVPADWLKALPGRYGNGSKGVNIVDREGKLFLTPRQGGFRVELRKQGDELVGDDRLATGPVVESAGPDRIKVDGHALDRVAVGRPEPPPERWRGLIGEYGWDHDTLYILEKEGRLHALIEWFFLYPLEEESADVFAFPKWGLYDGEKLNFSRDDHGRARQVEAASVVFPRRPIPGEDAATFRITSLRPVAELRAEALAAQPPTERGPFREPDLVELTSLDPTIRLDIRYATANNFLSTPVYTSARAFLQRPVAEAVVKAHRKLQQKGYGLLIHDAYRPWHVTKMFWDATAEPDHIFVADPTKGSRHNRGAAVDLTLCNMKTGEPVPMVGGYDEFSTRSYPDYPGGTSLQRWQRDLLRTAMEEQGFTVFPMEWWHFDAKDWQVYPILNITFEKLSP
ncbi:MAG TPA: serine hydrolase, partial [Isosphaeraceae bacterium]|nr:serine hydrolase [Isosphaeraceae bacterium]